MTCSLSFVTSLEPISPVPPMTTIFIRSHFHAEADRSGP